MESIYQECMHTLYRHLCNGRCYTNPEGESLTPEDSADEIKRKLKCENKFGGHPTLWHTDDIPSHKLNFAKSVTGYVEGGGSIILPWNEVK